MIALVTRIFVELAHGQLPSSPGCPGRPGDARSHPSAQKKRRCFDCGDRGLDLKPNPLDAGLIVEQWWVTNYRPIAIIDCCLNRK